MNANRADSIVDKVIETKLRTAVERAVRPVRATFGRKRGLREELLAHLTCVFEEEQRPGVDADEALSRALARFGEPRELAQELQSTVPHWNRGLSRLQYVPQPSDFTPWGVLRAMLIFTAVFYGLMFALFYGLRLLHFAVREPELFLYSMCVIAVCSIAFYFPFHLAAERLGKLSLERNYAPSWRSAGLLLAAAVAFPLWVTSICWGLTGELLSGWRVLLPVYCAGLILGPLLAIVQGRRFVQDRHYLLEWAELEVDR